MVDPDWIADNHDDPGVRLIEVDVSSAAYEAGHIPGAVLWNAYADLRNREYRPVPRAELERLLGRTGARPETTLVVYGYGAALGFWLMKAQGHDDVRMLEGDREQWPDSGREWSTEVPGPVWGFYELAAENEEIQASRAMVEAAIADPAQVLLDVRSELEFSGERFWPSGASEDTGRAGHLPGALNVPIDLLRKSDGSLKSTAELRSVFEHSALSPEKTTIVYCTIANRASQAWFALSYLLGYSDVRVYYGSWVEWGKAEDTPIETQ